MARTDTRLRAGARGNGRAERAAAGATAPYWANPTVLAALIGVLTTLLAGWLAAPSYIDGILDRYSRESELQSRRELDKIRLVLEHPGAILPATLEEGNPLAAQKARLMALAADTDRARARRNANAYARLGLIPPEWADIDGKTAPLTEPEKMFLRFAHAQSGAADLGLRSPSDWDLCKARVGAYSPYYFPIKESDPEDAKKRMASLNEKSSQQLRRKLARCRPYWNERDKPSSDPAAVLKAIPVRP